MVNKIYYIAIFTIVTLNNVEAIPVLSTAAEVVSFGIDVYSFFDSIFDDEDEPEPIDYGKIINTISERIDASLQTTVFEIEIQSHLSDLRRVVTTIQHFLTNMKYILEEKDKSIRDEDKRRFRKDFNVQKTDIYSIQRLLSTKISSNPGLTRTLLELLTKKFRCGMTQLDDFQNYYMTLVSNAVAISLFNERLSEGLNLYNQTLERWQDATEHLLVVIDNQKEGCKKQFGEFAKTDLDSSDNLTELFENNKNRYPYMTNGVYYLTGTYCVRTKKNYDKIFKKGDDRSTTIAVFSDDINVTLHSYNVYKRIASTLRIERCKADNDNLALHFDLLNQTLLFSLIYESSRRQEFKILQDKAAVTTHSVVDGTNYTTIFFIQNGNYNTSNRITSDNIFEARLASDGNHHQLSSFQRLFVCCFTAYVVMYYFLVQF